MKRAHWVILVVVAIVLALFALRLNEKADVLPAPVTLPSPPMESPAEKQAREQRPGASIGREDPGIGTTSLPRAPGTLERP